MRPLISLFFFVNVFSGFSQRLSINTQHQPERIHLWLRYAATSDSDYQIKMQQSFIKGIQRFNQRKNQFVAIADSSQQQNFLILTVDSIEYASKKESWKAVLLNGGLIAGHTIMLTKVGWTVPVLFFFNASTITTVRIQVSDDLAKPGKQYSLLFLENNGLFASRQRQQQRNISKLSVATYRLLKKVNRKYSKT
jgi:hypothetical protein